MNAADRLFARIAIEKSFVLPADVEEAQHYLEQLSHGPGGKKLPLSLGSILTKLGKLKLGQVVDIQKAMEPAAFTCASCGRRSFHIEAGEPEQCEVCLEAGTRPPEQAQEAPPPPKKAEQPPGASKGEKASWVRPLDQPGSERMRAQSFFSQSGAGSSTEKRTGVPSDRARKLGSEPPAEAARSTPRQPQPRQRSPAVPGLSDSRIADTLTEPYVAPPPLPVPPQGAQDRGGGDPLMPPVEDGALPADLPSVGSLSESAWTGFNMPPLPAAAERADAGAISVYKGTRASARTEPIADDAPSPMAPPSMAPPPSSHPESPSRSSKHSSQQDAFIGRTIGGCRLERLLGRGGMGTVYRATQLDLDRPVAFKILSPALTQDPKQVQQFFREAKALAKLEHPNIVAIYNVGKEEDVHFLVMQLVEGGSLETLLKSEGPKLPVERATKLIAQAATGLLEAHQKGIIHRDVKPANLLVSGDDRVLVTDFGLARMEGDAAGFTFGEGRMIGTPHFMSPEQIDGRSIDSRTDVYALGATLYYVLTGETPFRGLTTVEILLKHVNESLIPPKERAKDIPASVSRIVEKMMEKDRDRRYGSLRDMLRDLEAAQKGQDVKVDLAPKESPTEVAPAPALIPIGSGAPSPPVRIERPRSFYYVVGGLLLALVAVVFLGLKIGAAEPAPAVESPREREAAAAVSAAGQETGQRARVVRLREAASRYAGTSAAASAGRAADEIEVGLKKKGGERVKSILEKGRDLRAAGKHGLALVELDSLEGELKDGTVERPLLDEATAVREELRVARAQAFVPEGVFTFGEHDLERQVRLPAYYVDLFEVSNRDYEPFVKAGHPAPPGWVGTAPPKGLEDVPVTGVPVRLAQAFAASKGKRLPTEEEWEKAARGTERRRYPWGDEQDAARANARGGRGRLESVHAREPGASPLGCLGMAGNAAEWTLTPAAPDQKGGPTDRVRVKGGAFVNDLIDCRISSFNDSYGPDDADPAIGFRMVQDLER